MTNASNADTISFGLDPTGVRPATTRSRRFGVVPTRQRTAAPNAPTSLAPSLETRCGHPWKGGWISYQISVQLHTEVHDEMVKLEAVHMFGLSSDPLRDLGVSCSEHPRAIIATAGHRAQQLDAVPTQATGVRR